MCVFTSMLFSLFEVGGAHLEKLTAPLKVDTGEVTTLNSDVFHQQQQEWWYVPLAFRIKAGHLKSFYIGVKYFKKEI